MKKLILLILTSALSLNIIFAQQKTEPLTINPTNKGGLLDGSCGNDEWEAATKIELPGQAAIHFMHDEDYFYFCASGKAEDYTILDLYIEKRCTRVDDESQSATFVLSFLFHFFIKG